MVAIGSDEDLGLVAQAAKGDRMNDAVAVALEDVPGTAGTVVALGMEPPARARRVGCNTDEMPHSVPSGTILSVWELVQLKASIPTLSGSPAKIAASSRPRNGPITSRTRSSPLAT